MYFLKESLPLKEVMASLKEKDAPGLKSELQADFTASKTALIWNKGS